MIYDKRNRENINKLAYHTRLKASEWYSYCIRNNINILIYETIRDEQTQRKYVREGKSQTMKSYHLVGQALDFVPVNNKGETLWNGYEDSKIKQAINEAKRLGFTWGGDWKGFKDKPHLQYEYKGYGTDSFNKPSNDNTNDVNIDDLVKRTIRGEFGNGEERKRRLGKYYQQVQDIINGKDSFKHYNDVNIDDLVKRTIRGEFGNGEERKRRLGKYYQQVQDIINKKLL